MLEIVFIALLIAAGVLYFHLRPNHKPPEDPAVFIPKLQEKPYYFPGKNRGIKRPEIPPEWKKILAKRYAGKCGYTGIDLKLPGYDGRFKAEFDHIIPYDFGGETELWNLMPVTAELNQAKKDKITFYARELAHQLGRSIGDANGTIEPYWKFEEAFLTTWRMRKERKESRPEPRPHWLILASGDALLLKDYEFNRKTGLEAQEEFLNHMASFYHQNIEWRRKSKIIRENYYREIAQ